MNYQEIITTILEICIIPLLGILTKMLVTYLQTKSKELASKTDNEIAEKYIKMLTETITSCVISTNQTYVESLKNKGEFTAEAQKAAFKDTYENVLKILSEDCKDYLQEAFGDLETYITNRIEAEVKAQKI